MITPMVCTGAVLRAAALSLLTPGYLLASAGAWGASTVPFADAFNYPDGTLLDGTNGWGVAGNGSAIVTNGRAQLGNVAVSNGGLRGQAFISD